MKKVLSAVAMIVVLTSAWTAHAALYISQIYGGGGATAAGPTYKYDYIELYNNGPAAVDITGWSLQYASAAGAFGTTNWHSLTGTIGANSYFLVQESTAPGGTPGTAGADLPVIANMTGKLNLSATAGKVALVNSNTTLTGGVTTTGVYTAISGAYIDLIGYGTGTNFNNGKAATAAVSSIKAVFQDNNGTLTVGAPSLHLQSDYSATATPTPTPIPAAAWLLGSGLLGLVGMRRKQG